MAIAREHGKLLFRKLERDLIRLSSGQEAENVHSFRTTTRRLQTLLELIPADGRNQKKLLKMLERIRRRAGRVRDLDVQLGALRSLKVPLEPRRKTQLMQRLLELRARHEKKLRKLLKERDLRDLRRRLRRTGEEVDFKMLPEPLVLAQKMLISAAPPNGPVNEESLHRWRLAVKRARYAAEFAPKSAEKTQLITQLKRLQDTLGHWHDWLTLTDTAVEQFGEINHSSLVAALHNVTRGKFRQAVDAVSGWHAGRAITGPASLQTARKRGAKIPAAAARSATAA